MSTSKSSLFRLTNKVDTERNQVFSGCDIIPVAYNGSGKLIPLGTIKTLTISSHTTQFPVRSFGKTEVLTYKKGTTNRAGSMIFAELNQGALSELSAYYKYDNEKVTKSRAIDLSKLPPFDVIISMGNEYGELAYMRIYGISISDEGSVFDINQSHTENTVMYVCLGVDRLTPVSGGFRSTAGGYFNIIDNATFYGRYDLNNLETEEGVDVSFLLGYIDKLKNRQRSLVVLMAEETDNSILQKLVKEYNDISLEIQKMEDAIERVLSGVDSIYYGDTQQANYTYLQNISVNPTLMDIDIERPKIIETQINDLRPNSGNDFSRSSNG